jgi:predicted dinucleotide-binding enzyme
MQMTQLPQRIGIIGSGAVGQALGVGFAKSGYQVKIGSREPTKLKDWTKQVGPNGLVGSNTEAANFGDLLVICTKWSGTENAITIAGKEHFANKVVLDVTNPLVVDSPTLPPKPGFGYPNSAGKTIQSWLPKSLVVKAFNSVPANYMCNPTLQEGQPDLFIAGNDDTAKKTITALAEQWGWKSIHDMGDITQSYLIEDLAMLWIRWGFLNNHWTHAFKLLKK